MSVWSWGAGDILYRAESVLPCPRSNIRMRSRSWSSEALFVVLMYVGTFSFSFSSSTRLAMAS